MDWRLAILDEAQAIKNPSTRQSRAAKKLPVEARIVLTGTPVENRLGDLWSLFDLLNPGLLGSAKVFKSFIKSLEEREENRFAPLRQLVSPYILRRLKTDRAIIADLPDKTETTRFCNLTKQQIKLYEQVVQQMQSALKDADGMTRRGLVLQTLMRLKQVCNHPSQLCGDGEYGPADSGKFQRLGEICDELAQRQEKVRFCKGTTLSSKPGAAPDCDPARVYSHISPYCPSSAARSARSTSPSPSRSPSS